MSCALCIIEVVGYSLWMLIYFIHVLIRKKKYNILPNVHNAQLIPRVQRKEEISLIQKEKRERSAFYSKYLQDQYYPN